MAVWFVRSAEGQIVQGTMRRERPIKTLGETLRKATLDGRVPLHMASNKVEEKAKFTCTC